jgi:hypothetical protein
MYHEHLRRKEEIRANIEAMEREKNFLEQLNPTEVAIMFQKKKEYALLKEREDFNEQYSPERMDRILRLQEERSRSPSPDQSGSPAKKYS